LIIRGFESAFFANLAYILENTTACFNNSAFNDIYHDDGINISKGKRTIDKMSDWSESFQARVN